MLKFLLLSITFRVNSYHGRQLPSLLHVEPGDSTHVESSGVAVSLGEVEEESVRLEELEGRTSG